MNEYFCQTLSFFDVGDVGVGLKVYKAGEAGPQPDQ